MKKQFIKFIRFIIRKKRNLYYKSLGFKIGKNSKLEKDVMIDPSFPWLIEIGENVTIASRVYILAHDGSTKNYLGYSKIGRVIIEDNVFIGTNSIILPNVKIGKNSIIGANSVVTKDIPENVVAAGNPASVICSTNSYLAKNKKRLSESKIYDDIYKRDYITDDIKAKHFKELDKCGIAFID